MRVLQEVTLGDKLLLHISRRIIRNRRSSGQSWHNMLLRGDGLCAIELVVTIVVRQQGQLTLVPSSDIRSLNNWVIQFNSVGAGILYA